MDEPMRDLAMSYPDIRKAVSDQYGNEDFAPCFQQLLNFTTNMRKFPFNIYELSMPKDLFDIGTPKLCKMIPEYGKLVMRYETVSTVSGGFRLNVCIPKECANSKFLDYTFKLLNRIGSDPRVCLNQWSSVYFHDKVSTPQCSQDYTLPNDFQDNKREQYQYAKFIWLIIIGGYSLIILMSTGYDIILRYKKLTAYRESKSDQVPKSSLTKSNLVSQKHSLMVASDQNINQELLKELMTKGKTFEDDIQIYSEDMNDNGNEMLDSDCDMQNQSLSHDQGSSKFNFDGLLNNTLNIQSLHLDSQIKNSTSKTLMRHWKLQESKASLNSQTSPKLTQVIQAEHEQSFESLKKQNEVNFLNQDLHEKSSFQLLENRNQTSYFTIFSLARSLDKLLNRGIFKKNPFDQRPELLVHEGIKCLIFIWLCFFISGNFQLDLYIRNKWKFIETLMYNQTMWVIFITAQIGIDFFYMYSAFFLSNWIIKIARECNGLTIRIIAQIYISRFIRILPLYYFVLFFFWPMIWYLGYYDLWITYDNVFYQCGSYWWTHLLFVNNFIPTYRKGNDACMNWAAFATVELQLFIFLPLVMLMIFKFRRISIAILCFLIVADISLTGFIVYHYEFLPGYLFAVDLDPIQHYGIKPYTRVDSYAFGILTALYYQHILWYQNEARPSEQRQYTYLTWYHKSNVGAFLLWFFSVMCFLLHLLSYFHINVLSGGKMINELLVDSNGEMIRVANAVIMPFAKILGLVSLSLLIVFFATGNTSIYYHALGNPFWQSLRKLIFGAYLILPLVSKAYMATQDINFMNTVGSMFYLNFVNIGMTFAAAFVLYMVIECPIGDFLRLVVTDIFRTK